jgi:hypothetical protein
MSLGNAARYRSCMPHECYARREPRARATRFAYHGNTPPPFRSAPIRPRPEVESSAITAQGQRQIGATPNRTSRLHASGILPPLLTKLPRNICGAYRTRFHRGASAFRAYLHHVRCRDLGPSNALNSGSPPSERSGNALLHHTPIKSRCEGHWLVRRYESAVVNGSQSAEAVSRSARCHCYPR